MIYLNGVEFLSSPTIQGTVDPGTGLTIPAFTLSGKLTAGANEIEGSAFDINGGTIDGVTLALGANMNVGNYILQNFRVATSAVDQVIAIYSKRQVAGQGLTIYTTGVAAGYADTLRLNLTGGAAESDATWTNVIQKGLKLGGALDANSQSITSLNNSTFIATTGILSTVDNSYILMCGATSGYKGALLLLYGSATEQLAIQTPNAALDGALSRMTISGGIDVAVATWANITHTGIVTSDIDINGGTIDGVTITSPAINGTISTSGLNMPAFTAQGHIVPNASVYNLGGSTKGWALIYMANAGYLRPETYTTGQYYAFYARDVDGAAYVEVARAVNANDPYFSFGGSQENLFYNSGAVTIGGQLTYSIFPLTPSAAPDANYEVANKKYVDDSIGASVATGTYTGNDVDTGRQITVGFVPKFVHLKQADSVNTWIIEGQDADESVRITADPARVTSVHIHATDGFVVGDGTVDGNDDPSVYYWVAMA